MSQSTIFQSCWDGATPFGITSTFWEVNVSCSRILQGDPSEDRIAGLLLRSPMLKLPKVKK